MEMVFINYQLTVTRKDGQFLVDSRDVATMIERPHNDLMKSIRQYVEYLTKGNFPLSEFFIESTYQDSTNRTLPCYDLTRKGCDMVANKMTGEKGVLFTATYVTKFEEMEQQLNKEMSPLEVMQMAINQLVNQEKFNNEIKRNQLMIQEKVDKVAESFNDYSIRIGDKSAYIVARELHLNSKNHKPHFNFIDAIAKKIGFYSGVLGTKNELISVIMDNTHNGQSGTAVYYTDKSIELMKEYLKISFELKILRYERNYGSNKKGDPKEYQFTLGSKDWCFDENTYKYYSAKKVLVNS